ncbi:MAG TPA: nuclear transport factor 2 family protein [Candidatus Sulfotelmatobacter sp.]|nr:nuclear transport factor 2 family protein [Candidatus Sulfotelmatobacter sp.]
MRWICILWIFMYAGSLPTPAQDTEAAVKSRVMALEKLWNQAYKSGDTKALDSILDDGIVLVNDDGSMQTKAEFLATVKAPAPATAQQQQVSPESFSVHVYGSVAIATGIMRVKGEEGGRPYNRRERFVDTWVYKHGNWVCVGTNATPVLH